MSRANGITRSRLSASAFMTTAILERIQRHDRPIRPQGAVDIPLVACCGPGVWIVSDPVDLGRGVIGEVYEVKGRFHTVHGDGDRGYIFDSLRRAVSYLEEYADVCRQWM